MKYILFVLFIFYGTLTAAQAQANRFDHSVQNEAEYSERGPGTGNGNGGNDGLEGDDPLPVPIDDYIPLLLIIAIGLIIYNTQMRKKMLPYFLNFYRNK